MQSITLLLLDVLYLYYFFILIKQYRHNLIHIVTIICRNKRFSFKQNQVNLN